NDVPADGASQSFTLRFGAERRRAGRAWRGADFALRVYARRRGRERVLDDVSQLIAYALRHLFVGEQAIGHLSERFSDRVVALWVRRDGPGRGVGVFRQPKEKLRRAAGARRGIFQRLNRP